MYESSETAVLDEGRLDQLFTERVLSAARVAAPQNRLRASVEEVVDLAEESPRAAREALWELQGDHDRLTRIEAFIGGREAQATLGLGAAIQIARSELGSAKPNLRGRLPELLRWLDAN